MSHVIPGVNIKVLAEGLIAAVTPGARIIGIVGTACKGPVGEAVLFGDKSAVRETFGPPDPLEDGANDPYELTLTRAIELAFDGGATLVYGVRLAADAALEFEGAIEVVDSNMTPVDLKSIYEGAWYNNVRYSLVRTDSDTKTTPPFNWAFQLCLPSSTWFDHDVVEIFANDPPDVNNPSLEITFNSARGDAPYLQELIDALLGKSTGLSVDGCDAAHDLFSSPEAIDDTGGDDIEITTFQVDYFAPGTIDIEVVVSGDFNSGGDVIIEGLDEYGISATETVNFTDLLVTGSPYNSETTKKFSSVTKVTFSPGGTGTGAGTIQLEVQLLTDITVAQDGTNQDEISPAGDITVIADLYELVEGTAGTLDIDLVKRTVDGSGNEVFYPEAGWDFSGTDQKGTCWSADDSALPPITDVNVALDALKKVTCHIVLIAGADEDDTGYFAAGLTHCTTLSNNNWKKDRVFMCGSAVASDADDLISSIVTGSAGIFNNRAWVIAGGEIIANDWKASGYPEWNSQADEIVLSGGYCAAKIAGMIIAGRSGNQGWHEGITNMPYTASKLEFTFDYPDLYQLVSNGFIVIKDDVGFRVTKGISHSARNDPFHQINVLGTVDYAKYGLRETAAPFIGLLNNARVRGIVQSKFVAFLQGMLASEMITAYECSVTATREQEIQGIADATVLIQPTFLIDFIDISMVLQ